MRLTNKDTLGLALSAVAVVLLVSHGRTSPTDGGATASGVDAAASSHSETADAPGVVAFVNVLLLEATHSVPRRGVAVVRGGVVSAVGSAEGVDVPAGAAIIDGGGSYLVATTSGSRDSSAWTPVAEGIATDLVLLESDPRKALDGLVVQGRLSRGRWSPDGGARSVALPAGH